MAALHAGALPFNCHLCQCDPSLKEEWGCEKPTQVAVWVDDEDDDEFYSCPIQFIPGNVFGWYREYGYYKEFPGSAPPYFDRSARWLEAMQVYTQDYTRFVKEQQAARSRKHSNSTHDAGELKRMMRERNDGTNR